MRCIRRPWARRHGLLRLMRTGGAAGVYGPPDRGMPEDGVLAMGVEGVAQWVFAEIDTALVAGLRADGGVLNARHWGEQPGAVALPPVEVVDLR